MVFSLNDSCTTIVMQNECREDTTDGAVVKLPRKGLYRQRAHCNPLTDVHFDVPTKPADIDWSEHFPELYEQAKENNEAGPKVDFVDIGCGFGGMTITLAREFPNKLTVGMEIRAKVSQYVKDRIIALRKKEPGKYRNASCIRTNTMKHLVQYFEKGQLEKMLFLFPDPQFKTTKHRRRIIQTTLLDEYAYVMKSGGVLYTITDVEDLAIWMREKLEKHPLFELISDAELAQDPVATFIETMTEEGQKVKRNGGQTWKAIFRRR